jgi:GNAT superfamily N-acetyltransferase
VIIAAMAQTLWTLRTATTEDRDFLFDLHRVTMGSYIDSTWGWDDRRQELLFDEHFAPDDCQIIQVNAEDAGVLAVEETDAEIWLGLIEIHPRWQGEGIGTSVIQSLLRSGAKTNRPVALRVLRTNTSARSLYERLGFTSFRETETRIYLRADPPPPSAGEPA